MGVSENQSGEQPLTTSDDVSETAELSRRTFLNRALVVGGAATLGVATGRATNAFAKPLATSMRKVPRSTSARKVTLKFSMAGAADSAEGRAAVRVAKRISELTHGEVGMLVYPNFTLASSDAVQIQQLVVGALDIAAVSSWTNLFPAGIAFDLPYAFATLGQLRKAFAGPPGATVRATAPPLGIRILDWWALTWRNLYGSKPIYNPNDLQGVKVRTQGTKALNAYYAACGAFPQSIDSKEVYLALQTKQVSLVESSLQYCFQQKHYEVAKYGSVDHHGVSTWALTISNKTWDNLTSSQQKAVQQAFSESIAPHDKDSTSYVQSLIPQLKKDGMTINTPDLKPFAKIAAGIYPQIVTSDAQKQVLSQLQAMGYAKH